MLGSADMALQVWVGRKRRKVKKKPPSCEERRRWLVFSTWPKGPVDFVDQVSRDLAYPPHPHPMSEMLLVWGCRDAERASGNQGPSKLPEGIGRLSHGGFIHVQVHNFDPLIAQHRVAHLRILYFMNG